MRSSGWRAAVVAVGLVLSLGGGLARAAVHRDAHRAAGTPERRSPVPLPTPPAATFVLPMTTPAEVGATPTPTGSTTPSAALVQPVTGAPPRVAQVRADLAQRTALLDPELAAAVPDRTDGGFSDLAAVVAGFTGTEQANERTLLTDLGLQGEVTHAWSLLDGGSAVVTLTVRRFSSAAGARQDLLDFADGPAGSQQRLHKASTDIPEAVAFDGTSTQGRPERLTFQSRGPYLVEVVAAQDEGGSTDLVALARAVQIAEVTLTG